MKNFTVSNIDSQHPPEPEQKHWQDLDPVYEGKRLEFAVEYIKINDEMMIRFRKNEEVFYAFIIACKTTL